MERRSGMESKLYRQVGERSEEQMGIFIAETRRKVTGLTFPFA